MNDVDNVHAATLLAHGNADFNVMTKNAAQFYDAIKAQRRPAPVLLPPGRTRRLAARRDAEPLVHEATCTA